MTTIRIDDRTIRTRTATDPIPMAALERTLQRLYGRHAFMKPRYGEKWRNGGQQFAGWVDIYRDNRNTGSGWSASLVASHVRIEVNA